MLWVAFVVPISLFELFDFFGATMCRMTPFPAPIVVPCERISLALISFFNYYLFRFIGWFHLWLFHLLRVHSIERNQLTIYLLDSSLNSSHYYPNRVNDLLVVSLSSLLFACYIKNERNYSYEYLSLCTSYLRTCNLKSSNHIFTTIIFFASSDIVSPLSGPTSRICLLISYKSLGFMSLGLEGTRAPKASVTNNEFIMWLCNCP